MSDDNMPGDLIDKKLNTVAKTEKTWRPEAGVGSAMDQIDELKKSDPQFKHVMEDLVGIQSIGRNTSNLTLPKPKTKAPSTGLSK
jgi:hypothetical protein